MGGPVVTVFKVLASISAVYMCFSPSKAMYRIHKQRSTGVMSVVPLIALFVASHACLLYGYTSDNYFPIFTTYLIGDLASVAFTIVYFRYSNDRRNVLKLSAIALFLCAILTTYAVLGKNGKLGHSPRTVDQVVGYINVATAIVMYTSPFSTIMLVIRTKSAESVPFAMVLVGLLNNTLWAIYGFLIMDVIVIAPCVASVVIGLIQVVLYFIFHPKKRTAGGIEIEPTETLAGINYEQQTGIDKVDANHITIHVEEDATYYKLQSPHMDRTVHGASAFGKEHDENEEAPK
ncbi:hypothetical protein Poli38472_007522 [Pythium oligandrum]|uniref:Sugar transporter SWEET1 n=1 Tax=Pythium oligandrum TaxID=41045 RepID=A0A8K1CSD0_PYTOL|nr:hypothetical protein Poli38472_007522 [Pythium oligandrum]|eukprot:TMW67850.1 hypothetical protein Poli38472_007522 [Pythium oligandrum]